MPLPDQTPREALQATFAVRLNQLLDGCAAIPTQGRGRIDAAARYLDIPVSTIQRLLVGAVLPEVHRLAAIAERLNVTTDFLLGRASIEESQRVLQERSGRAGLAAERHYVAIPILNPDPELRDEAYFHIPRAHLRRFIQPAEAASLIVMRGDAMAPTIENGELLFISLLPPESPAILAEGLYALRRREDGGWAVRRLQAIGGDYQISCDNSVYASVRVPRAALGAEGEYEWEVAGRVRTHLRRY